MIKGLRGFAIYKNRDRAVDPTVLQFLQVFVLKPRTLVGAGILSLKFTLLGTYHFYGTLIAISPSARVSTVVDTSD